MNIHEFTVERDIIIAREVAMYYIKNYLRMKQTTKTKLQFLWLCYELWLNEQYKDNVNRCISIKEFEELLLFKFDDCVTKEGLFKIEVNIERMKDNDYYQVHGI